MKEIQEIQEIDELVDRACALANRQPYMTDMSLDEVRWVTSQLQAHAAQIIRIKREAALRISHEQPQGGPMSDPARIIAHASNGEALVLTVYVPAVLARGDICGLAHPPRDMDPFGMSRFIANEHIAPWRARIIECRQTAN